MLCRFVGIYQCCGGTYCLRAEDLKMEAVCSSETFVSIYKVTKYYNPKDQHCHGRENIKSHEISLPVKLSSLYKCFTLNVVVWSVAKF
jgi:hypothetical protein